MANRDLTNFREVQRVIAEPTSDLVPTVAKLGQDIIRQSQEAKIVENMSAAQLDLNRLTNEFQTQYEGDPFNEQGIKEFREKRAAVLEGYGSNISPMFGRAWKENASRLANQNDLMTQSWGYKQAAVNTKNSIGKSMQNYLNQAALDGETFGADGADNIDTFLNYAQAREQLDSFGGKYLGEESVKALTDSFEQDWAKTFISGVAKENPVKALRLMENEAVKSTITDENDFAKFRDAIETRAIKFQDVAIQNEVLGKLKNGNALLASGRTLSYAEIQQASSGLSEPAKEYFMKVNGYSDGADGAVGADGLPLKGRLKLDQKLQYKAEIYDDLTQAAQAENIETVDIERLQNKIYDGMRRGAITQEEGAEYLDQIFNPVIEQKQAALEDYSGGDWNPFKENVGLTGINKYLESTAIKPAEGEEEAGKISSAINSANKANLYDSYMKELRVEAAKNNVRIADIPKLDNAYDVYAKAQAAAINNFKTRSAPVLNVQPSIPITAIKKLIENPEKAEDFDAMFGNGTANRILGRE